MPRKTNTKETTLIQLCVSRLGFTRGCRLSAFIDLWRVAQEKYDRPITMAEFVAESGMNRATAYRCLADFRRVFNAGVEPGDVVAHWHAHLAARRVPTRLALQPA
jgi:hypothetical protein